MKLKIILFHIILLMINTGALFCQNAGRRPGESTINSAPSLCGELFSPVSQPEIITYYYSEWISGDIFLEGGSVARGEKIKYNGMLDELFWLEPVSKQTILLDKGGIVKFRFLDVPGDTVGCFTRLKVKGSVLSDSVEIFAEEIYHGEPSLFIQHSWFLARQDVVPMNKTYTLKDIYKEEPVCYLRFNDGRLVNIRSFSRRNIYSLFPDKKDQIREFLNRNMPGKIRTEDEIIQLVKFINSF